METYREQPFAELDRQYAELEKELQAARLRFIREQVESLCLNSGTA